MSCRNASNHPLATDFQHSHSRAAQVYTEALTYSSPLSTDQGAMTVLGEEILKGAHGAEEKVMQATWHVTVTNTGTVKVTTI